MQIRKAEITDIEILLPQFDAYLAFYKCEPARDKSRIFLTENLSQRRSTIFIATNEQGQVVGFTQLYQRLLSLSMMHCIYLSDLYVDKDFRKQGVAKLLMKKVEEYSIAIGAINIQLETEHSNAQAQALYKSLNYQLDQNYRTYVLKLPSPGINNNAYKKESK